MGGVKISDVARLAGVSAMTVSRVVNGRGAVSAGTRERVMEAVRRLGYSPNAAARRLATGQADRIGLIYSNPSPGYLSEFLLGALAGARRIGAQLIVEPCDAGPGGEGEALRRLAGGGVKAVILPPPHGESGAALGEARALGMVVAAVATGVRRTGEVTVRIDDRAAAAAMTRRLLALGHRRLGFITGAADQSASAEREAGFRGAVDGAGAEAVIEAGDFTYRGGFAAAERLLDRPDRPTAVFASNDEMAAATVAAAHRRGLDVPRDLTVVGFDDTGVATSIWPALTTVRQPVAEMAETAAARLGAAQAAPGGVGEDHVLPHVLIERDSSGPPA